MLIVHVDIHIQPTAIAAFKAATIANASASVQEPGIARFDVLQDNDDPTHFVLVEIYRSQEATVAHKGWPSARPSAALLPAWNGTRAPATRAARASAAPARESGEDMRSLQGHRLSWEELLRINILNGNSYFF